MAAGVLVLLLAQAASQTPARDQKPVRSQRSALMAGRVVDAESGAPIPRAVVQVRRDGPGERTVGVETGLDGAFRFQDLVPGAYRVVALPPDHQATHVSQDLNGRPPELWISISPPSIVLHAGDRRDDLRMRLPRALVVDGRVVDEFGEPMPGATVATESGEYPAMAARGPATDDRGIFRLFGLRAGTYRICATPPRTLGRPADGVRRPPYLRTCYPSAPSGGGDRIEVGGTPAGPLTIVMQRLPGFTVSGRVTSASGLTENEVTIERLGAAALARITVNRRPGGGFHAGGLAPGRYLVRAKSRAPGGSADSPQTETAFRTIEIERGNVAGLELVTTRDGEATMAQDLALLPSEPADAPADTGGVSATPPDDALSARGLAISGRLLDEDGRPLAGVQMTLDTPTPLALSFATDDRGVFRLWGLAPGHHVICANPRAPVPYDLGVPRRSIFVSNCRAGHGEIDVTGVTLTDLDVDGVEIRMERHPAYEISGHILSADGGPADVASVQLLRLDQQERLLYVASTQPPGSFRLPNLTRGIYLLAARSRHFAPDAPGESQWGATVVEVTTSDVGGVVLQLKKAVSVKGTVIFDASPPEAVNRVQIHTRWAYESARPVAAPAAVVAADGTFELEGLFGPVVISAQSMPPGYALSSIRYRGKDVTHSAVDFDAGPAEGLEIVLTNRTATLAGTVRADAGSRASNTVIVCFPVDPERWRHFERLETSASADGSWRLPAIVAGEYYVAALQVVESQSLAWPRDYARIADVAQRLSIHAGDMRTLDLRPIVLRSRKPE